MERMNSQSRKAESPESKLELILALKLHVRLLPEVMVSHFLYITVFHMRVSAAVMLS